MSSSDRAATDESRILIEWYYTHKRDLPWRNTRDPYLIWISEIILQQTRVAQGIDYYRRFVHRFPDIRSLATAHIDEVLKYWQGLGYYSRARNLHEAAQQILTRFDGLFPQSYHDIRSLKGIGDYTAAAIASFVWNLPYPVIDGNVYRVLSRLFAIDTPIDSTAGKKEFTHLANTLMDRRKAGLHNQAIMEFGALQCTPQTPDCRQCPFADRCMGLAGGDVKRFPVKQNRTKTRNRYFHYFHIRCDDHTYLQRRGPNDIWEGLFEFPLIETEQPTDFDAMQQHDVFRSLFDGADGIVIGPYREGIKHVLSHQILYVAFYRIDLQSESDKLSRYLKVPQEQLRNYPVSKLTHNYLETLETTYPKATFRT